MHKLPEHMEGPIDNFILRAVEAVAPTLHKWGQTPNMITTYSLLTGLFSTYMLWKGNLVLFACASILSYFFDCADGYIARRYKQMSKFGDMYDHISDLTVNSLAFYVAIRRYGNILRKNLHILVLFLFVPIFMMFAHLGCQQAYHNPGPSIEETLDVFKTLCPSSEFSVITRYFSCASLKFIAIALVFYFESQLH